MNTALNPPYLPDAGQRSIRDVQVDSPIDIEIEQSLNLGEIYGFDCTRVELFSGAVRVGDDIDPSRIIEHASRYTSITIESSAGGRVLDVWRNADYAVIHDATGEGVAPGVVLSEGLLEFQVASLVASELGELSVVPTANAAVTDDGDGTMLLIGSGSSDCQGPKTAVINTASVTLGGMAVPGSFDIDVVPVSAMTAWAMIVEALRG